MAGRFASTSGWAALICHFVTHHTAYWKSRVQQRRDGHLTKSNSTQLPVQVQPWRGVAKMSFIMRILGGDTESGEVKSQYFRIHFSMMATTQGQEKIRFIAGKVIP